MALSPSEEALVRDLIAQNAALLSLASSEPTILSKLGATKATLSDLPVASSLSDTDLFLVRQGTTDKSVPRSLVAGGFAAINGSASQVFNVAAATAGTHAVRLDQVGVANAAVVKTAVNASGDPPIYACRAWVNFQGTGTVTIRASGNVASITDISEGRYRVNFATAMPDADYAVSHGSGNDSTSRWGVQQAVYHQFPTVNDVEILAADDTSQNTAQDCARISIAIFR